MLLNKTPLLGKLIGIIRLSKKLMQQLGIIKLMISKIKSCLINNFVIAQELIKKILENTPSTQNKLVALI